LFHENKNISGTKTIVVGDGGNHGGASGTGNTAGESGNDTTFTDLTTTAGGGAGGGESAGRTGGSSSGAGGRDTSAATAPTPPGQGHAGGTAGTDNFNGAGGGGAGGAGQNQSSRIGGVGLDYSSVFGTTYGDSGWFASGGTGSGSSDSNTAAPSGGGGAGGYYGETNPDSTTRWRGAQKHTGGGGGGCHYHLSPYNNGGKGGSGIVLVKFTAVKPAVIPWSTAIADPEPVADAPSLTLDATTEVATPTMNLNFTTDLTSFPKSVGRYNISTHDTLGVVFDRTATKKKRVTKTINTDKFTMLLTANNAASGTIGDLVTFGDDFTLAANTTTSGDHNIATNFDGTTSNVYVNGVLITSASTSVTSGAKLLKIGENYAGRIKKFKFWNFVKSSFTPYGPYLSVTATARTFDIGGTLGDTYSWYAIVDDDSRLDSDGKATINGVIQYQWDLYHPNTSQIEVGQNNKITFVPGTTVDNGTWYWLAGNSSGLPFGDHDSETFPASRTRLSNQTCNFSTWENTSWQTADAFVDGIIPTLGIND
jgi:hypothetical protein